MRMETKYLDSLVTTGTTEKCEFGDMKNNSTNFTAHSSPYSNAVAFGHKNISANEVEESEEDESGCRPKKVAKNVALGLTLSNHNLPNQPNDFGNKKNISLNSKPNINNTLNLSASGKRKSAQNRQEVDEDHTNSMTTGNGANNAANNGNVPVVSNTGGGQASNDTNCLKVPPLRIVISSSSGRSNLKDSNTATSQDLHATSMSGIQVNARNYVVSSATFDDSEQSLELNNRSPQHGVTSDNGFLSSNLSSFGSQAVGPVGFIGTCNAEGQSNNGSQSSGRITRSQRAAAQHSQLGDESNSRSSPAELDSTLLNNSELTAGQESSNKNEKESNKENKEHRRRKGRQKGSIANSNSNSSTTNATGQLNSFGVGPNHSSQIGCAAATSSGGEGAIEEDTDSMSSSISGNTGSLHMPSYNCLHMYQSIRKQVDKRRQSLFDRNLSPKAPQGFQQYLLNTGNYTLENRALTDDIENDESVKLPEQLKQEEQLCQLYHLQAQERNKMRVQHRIEKEKVKLSIEQEILRVHGRAALAMSNQSQPLSFATIMRDEEIYNTIDGETDEKCPEMFGASGGQGNSLSGGNGGGACSSSSTTYKESRNEYSRATYSCVSNLADLFALTGKSEDIGSRCRFSGRLLHSWLQDVEDKWTKIKKETIFRQRREAESLHAIQKLHWQWKICELGRKISLLDEEAEDQKIRRSEAWTEKMIKDEQLVPLVLVNDNFDLSS